MDWLDLLAVQGTLKSLLQHHSSKASILRRSAFFIVQLSHPYMTTGKTIAFTAAAAKSLQSCLTLCNFMNCSPPGSSQHVKKRDITFTTKVRLVKAMVFPVVMYGCESWTMKKADAKELMLLNCSVGEDSWESFGLQGDPTSPS